MTTRPERCSSTSAARDEPMAGTASTVRSWLLVEDAGPWGRDALRDARLPERVGLELRRRCRGAGVRPLLIRRVATPSSASPATRPEGIACFAIRSGPEPPWIERTRLGKVADALDLDLDGLGNGVRPGLDPDPGPLFLVCTHGRRDPCCAERGRPLANALARAFPDAAWQSSHVGGDRFAGNVVAFPHGWYLGRVWPEDAAEVAAAYARGRIALGHARGRSCRSMPVQAAEHALRVREGLDGIDDVELERAEEVDGLVTAAFATTAGRFAVAVRVDGGESAFLTCHSLRAEEPPTYRVTGISPLRVPSQP